jgi:hypothetical protein
LPRPFNQIHDEEGNLNSVIREYTVGTKRYNARTYNYSPIQVSNPNYTHDVSKQTKTHSITTINNKNYDVKYTDVRPSGSELITAQQFYTDLGLDVFDNIAIIVDAASIGLYDILTKGPKVSNKNIYYIPKKLWSSVSVFSLSSLISSSVKL